MTDSSKATKKAASKAASKATKTAPAAVESVVEEDAPPLTRSRTEGDHEGDVYLPKGYEYLPFPSDPINGYEHTPYPGAWTYTWDSQAKAWMCYGRGYQGPPGERGVQGAPGPAGDVASVVECAAPPSTATRGVFYLTSSNILLIGI